MKCRICGKEFEKSIFTPSLCICSFEIIETNNLWSNGEIPKERNIEDNAEFI